MISGDQDDQSEEIFYIYCDHMEIAYFVAYTSSK